MSTLSFAPGDRVVASVRLRVSRLYGGKTRAASISGVCNEIKAGEVVIVRDVPDRLTGCGVYRAAVWQVRKEDA